MAQYYRVLRKWEDRGEKGQLGAFNYNSDGLKNAKKLCDKHKDTFVFNNGGIPVYPLPFAVKALSSMAVFAEDTGFKKASVPSTGDSGVFTITKVKSGRGFLLSGIGWVTLAGRQFMRIETAPKVDYAEKVYKGAVQTYAAVCASRCKHKSGASTLEEIKRKGITTCNTSAGVSGQIGGIFPVGNHAKHTSPTKKNGAELLKVKRRLTDCVKNSESLNAKRAKWVFAGCLYKDLPADLKKRGNIYYYDSNAAVSAGNGKIFSTNEGGGQRNDKGEYYSLNKITMESGYCFTHTILWVAHPLKV